MVDWLLAFFAGLAGLVITVQVIAAWWGFVDHDRNGTDYWSRVLAPVVGYTGLLVACWWILPDALAAAFGGGFKVAVMIHLLNFALPVLGVFDRRRREEKGYRAFLADHRQRREADGGSA